MATRPDAVGRNLDLESAVGEVTARYESANPGSRAHYERARETMPGGNTRTGMFYPPFPLAIGKAAGATLTDVDGHTYTDFVGDYSAGLYGHSHPVIREAVEATLDSGISFGSASPQEARLAALVCARFPSVEQVRFTTSGTEGNMLAMVTARVVSGKNSIMVFEGAYHGGTIYFGREPSPIAVPFPFVIAPYNDPDEARRMIRENAHQLAAVLVEPLQGASGAIPASAEFLDALREACSAHDVLFDLRRGDDLAGGARRPPRAARHRPRPDHAREIHRGRLLLRRPRRPCGDHEDLRPLPARFHRSPRHLQQQRVHAARRCRGPGEGLHGAGADRAQRDGRRLARGPQRARRPSRGIVPGHRVRLDPDDAPAARADPLDPATSSPGTRGSASSCNSI